MDRHTLDTLPSQNLWIVVNLLYYDFNKNLIYRLEVYVYIQK